MRRGSCFGTAAVLVAVFVAMPVLAQPQRPDDRGMWGGVKREPAWKTFAVAGRSLMKQGDCKRALDMLDQAIHGSVEPTLHRDRGLCHETVGNTIPAIEDYRKYLTGVPDGSDSEDIRERLRRLEGQPTRATIEPSPAGGGVTGSALGNATVSSGSGSAQASGGANLSLASTETAREDSPRGMNLDAVQQWERREADANTSPLRRGSGFIVGPYIHIRRFTQTGLGWGQAFGGTFRYSLGRTHTIVSEIGFSTINGTGTASSLGGFAGYLGYEARLGLDAYLTNQIYIGGGLGYEHLSQASLGAVFATLFPRGRVGFRHVFGAGVALEVGADGGYAVLRMLNAPPTSSGGTESVMIAGHVGFVLGF